MDDMDDPNDDNDSSSNDDNLATTAFVKLQDYSTNSDVVHNTGNETIQGDKTFNDTTTCNGIVYLSRFSHVPTPVVEDETNFFTDLVANVEFVQNTDTKINERIDTEVETLNGRIDNEVSTLNNTITTNVNTLNQTITNKETTITIN